MKTIYQRDKSGPQALTIEQLPEQRELHITTRKASGGVLVTRAAAHRRDGSSLIHVFGMGIKGMGDFSQVVAQRSIPRITARAVEQQHSSVIERLSEIKVLVELHYANQSERKAAHA